jgi:UDP-glucose 4-epimerase
MARVVLVTGVSRYIGGRCARAIAADPSVERVIGVDVVPPSDDLGNCEFVRADIRNPVIAKVVERAGVDTVVHLNVIATPTGVGGRGSMKEINVIGTMQLLAACQKAPGVRRLVVKSTSAVYGSGPSDPGLFTEDSEPRSAPRTGWGKDSSEVEGYVRGFARRRPDVGVLTLRLANLIGPGMRTPLTDYFTLPVVPTVFGFDARLQFLHEDDGVEAIRLAAVGDALGVVNVAGDGVLLLSQAARLAGRPILPVLPPFAGFLGQALRSTGLVDLTSEEIRYLRYGRALDTRRMRSVLGFEPKRTTRAAFEDFVDTRRSGGPLDPAVLDRAEQALRTLLAPLAGLSRTSRAQAGREVI